MFMFPFITLFSSMLLISVFMALSASQWLFIWMALELNMLSFIPLMFQHFSSQETEAAIKYFLIQALGSSLLLMASNSLFMSSNIPMILNLSSMIMLMSMLIKLGMAPFHFWFPSVMASLSWVMCLALSTWQKLIPMSILLMKISPQNFMMFSFLITSGALIGGVGGMNQTQLRPLLAYSSIGHMSWIAAAAIFSLPTAVFYLLSYIIISIPLMLTMNKSMITSQSTTSSMISGVSLFWIFFLIFSLSGMPPFLGFMPKMLVLMSLPKLSIVSLSLILGSLINLFYYLSIILSITLKSSSQQIITPSKSSLVFFPIMASFSSVLVAIFIYAMTMLNKP